MRDQPVRGEEVSGDVRGESDGSQPIDELIDDREARNDFWSIEGDYIYRHHVEPRVQVYVPKEETFQIPMRYIDVIRSPHTTLDVLQENSLDDNWKIDVNRNLSESWTRFTQFTVLNEKLPDGIMWSGKVADNKASDIQARGQKYGKMCQTQLNEKKIRRGLSNNRSSTM